MKLRIGILVILSACFALPALAYIPKTSTIMNRMAKNMGRGTYQIDQEVEFRSEGEPMLLRERWVVRNADSMRLSVSGAKGSANAWRLEVLYKDGKRYFLDPQGQAKSAPQSLEFIEPYLHFRSGRSIVESLVRQRILPPRPATFQTTAKTSAGVAYKQESFVRLARTGGVIAYAFGDPTPASSLNPKPGFWVEQDTFLFRRLRFPSQAEVEASKHILASGGLRIPRERMLAWGGNAATIRILQVRSLTENPATKGLLIPASISKMKAPAKLPENDAIKEFYQRFR